MRCMTELSLWGFCNNCLNKEICLFNNLFSILRFSCSILRFLFNLLNFCKSSFLPETISDPLLGSLTTTFLCSNSNPLPGILTNVRAKSPTLCGATIGMFSWYKLTIYISHPTKYYDSLYTNDTHMVGERLYSFKASSDSKWIRPCVGEYLLWTHRTYIY